METGYVKFFDTREGKLFGFLVDEKGNELFFHYSDERLPRLNETQDVILIESTSPMRYPKKGDRLVFGRSQNAKGPKARPWCFEEEYERMVEKSKRELTIDEAKEYLANQPCEIMEHTDSPETLGSVWTTVTTEITWRSEDHRRIVAKGVFLRRTTKHGYGAGKTEVENAVVIYVLDPKFKTTKFVDNVASELMTVGKPHKVMRGKKQGILWNGGWDDYVVDTNTVRDLTASEVEEIGNSSFPTIRNEEGTWLRCRFAKNLGHDYQVVKVLWHLGGGD